MGPGHKIFWLKPPLLGGSGKYVRTPGILNIDQLLFFYCLTTLLQTLCVGYTLSVCHNCTTPPPHMVIIMRPSSLGGGRILSRTLSVRLSVRPSRYGYRASRRAT